MDPLELQRILRRSEGSKLEFKREFYALNSNAHERHWSEFIKDILALANGNIGYAGQTGYLIIGADDKINSNGTRVLHSCAEIAISQQQIQNRVNSSCNPPVPDLQLERIPIGNDQLIIMVIPPSSFLHETIKDLTTTTTTFHKGTVFVRRGEDIHNATQDERDAIRNEKQRVFESKHIQSRLERRIKVSEEFIESRQADLTEQRLFLTPERYQTLNQIREEIDVERIVLDYLKTKLRFEQSLLPLNTDTGQRGKKYFEYAIKILKEKIPRIPSTLDAAKDIIEEMRDEARNALETAIKYGSSQPRIYHLLMELYDIRGESFRVYELGRDATDFSCDFADLYRLHMKICHFIKEWYEDYKEEAETYIQRHKQKLCQILKVEAVDDEGNPV